MRIAAGTAKPTGCTRAAATPDLRVILIRSKPIASASGMSGSGTVRPTRATCRAFGERGTALATRQGRCQVNDRVGTLGLDLDM